MLTVPSLTHSSSALQGAVDKHPRVRWAACQALGQMCTDLGPDLQEEQHATVLPMLIHLMDDAANPRVQVGGGYLLSGSQGGCGASMGLIKLVGGGYLLSGCVWGEYGVD